MGSDLKEEGSRGRNAGMVTEPCWKTQLLSTGPDYRVEWLPRSLETCNYEQALILQRTFSPTVTGYINAWATQQHLQHELPCLWKTVGVSSPNPRDGVFQLSPLQWPGTSHQEHGILHWECAGARSRPERCRLCQAQSERTGVSSWTH